MCWVLVVMCHRALLLSAVTGEKYFWIIRSLRIDSGLKRDSSSPGLGTQLVPLAKAEAGEMVPLLQLQGVTKKKEVQEEPDLLPHHVAAEREACRAYIFYDWKIMTKARNL